MSLKQMQFLDGASAIRQEPVRIMGFDCVCGRRMEISAEQGVVPAPQRTWVGLTDEDIKELDISNYVQVVKIVEAKLKEKNT